MSAQMSAEAQSGATGRKVTAVDTTRPDLNEAFNLVQRFVSALRNVAASQDLDIPDSHRDIAETIRAEFGAAVTRGLERNYVRARWLLPNEVCPEQFLRPSQDRVRIGRYNANGDRVLYLCRDSRTALAEITGSRPSEEHRCYVQKFAVRLPETNVVLLSPQMEKVSPALNRFLFMSETLPKDGNEAFVYRPTHLLRHWAETFGVAAVEYPSVRAGFPNAENAANLVVFGPTAQLVEEMMVGDPEIVS
jgi:hypothetical protein